VRPVAGGIAIAVLIVLAAAAYGVGFGLIGMAVAIVPAGIAYFVVRRWRLAAAGLEARSTCECVGPAVRYNGFVGTVHEFEFARRRYAEAFEAENAKKVV
jgi:hypothetical protein